MQYKLSDLIKGLDVVVQGDANCIITGVSPIQHSAPGHITFLNNTRYRKYLSETQASAVVLGEKDASVCSINAVVSKNPYYVYANIAAYFHKMEKPCSGIHPTAVIGEGSHIDPSASIGPHVVIGQRVTIGANAVIGPNCTIGDDCHIGEATCLDANVSVYYQVKIGKRVRIASGVVIGSDGFGFANEKGAWHKVPQLGSVIVGDDVDIGANTTIDRGAIEDTIIGVGVKMDNLIQIGHNVQIGDHSIMAGCTGVAGSTVIGKNCMIGGASCLTGHITICDNAVITGMTGVNKSITEPGIYSSGLNGIVTHEEYRRNSARFHRMDKLIERVKNLEASLKELTERSTS